MTVLRAAWLICATCWALAASGQPVFHLGMELPGFLTTRESTGYRAAGRIGPALGLSYRPPTPSRVRPFVRVEYAAVRAEITRTTTSPGGSSSETGVFALNHVSASLGGQWRLGRRRLSYLEIGVYYAYLPQRPDVTIRVTGSSVFAPGGFDLTRTVPQEEFLRDRHYGPQLAYGREIPLGNGLTLLPVGRIRVSPTDLEAAGGRSGRGLRPLSYGLTVGLLYSPGSAFAH